MSGHTHQPYNCVFNGIPTTSAYSFGRLVTDIDMRVDRATNDVTRLTINNRIVTRDVPEDQAILDLIARYNVVAAPIANRPIGHITADLPNTPTGRRAGDGRRDRRRPARRHRRTGTRGAAPSSRS